MVKAFSVQFQGWGRPASSIDCHTPDGQFAANLPSVFQKFLARPGVRAAGGNFGWLVADKGVRLVFNVGIGFWVARYLGPAQFGTLSYAIAVVGLVAILAELGLDAVVRRELIQSPDRAAPMLVTAAGMRLFGGLVAYGLLGVSVLMGWVGAPENQLLLILGLGLFQPGVAVTELWFQAHLRAKSSVPAQWSALFVGSVWRIGLILSGAGLAAFVWVLVAEGFLGALLLWWLVRRDGLNLRLREYQPALAGRLWRETWPLLVSGFAVMLYLRMDVIMLQHLSSQTSVGVYSAAVRFTEIWYFVPVGLASSLLPSILRARQVGDLAYLERMQSYYDLNAGLAYAVCVPLALLAPWVIGLAYGPDYAAAAPVLALHIWSSVFVFLGVARGQYLINEGQTGFYLGATVAGLLVNSTLNWLLIPSYGARGAAMATLVSQAVAAWLSSFCFTPVRPTAWMQTRALLIPLRWIRYVRQF